MKTASIIIIGNEILSGRTVDINSHYLAKVSRKRYFVTGSQGNS